MMVHHAIATFVAGACTWALVHGGDGHRTVLLLDCHGRDGTVEVGTDGYVSDDGRSYRRGSGGLLGPLSARASTFGRGGHGSVKRGELVHHALVLLLLISVHCLSMLAEVVETRKLL